MSRLPSAWALLLAACARDPGSSCNTCLASASTGECATGPTSSVDPAGDTTQDASGSFLAPPDLGGDCGDAGACECSLLEQDCGDDQKCAPYADDAGDTLNARRCVPLVPEPATVGEACSSNGGSNTGLDNCVAGALCRDTGVCAALCADDHDCDASFTCNPISAIVSICVSA